jgi:hypothetical protein
MIFEKFHEALIFAVLFIKEKYETKSTSIIISGKDCVELLFGLNTISISCYPRTSRSFAREVITRALEYTLTAGAVLPAHKHILRPRSYHTGSGIHTYSWSSVTRVHAPKPKCISEPLCFGRMGEESARAVGA